MELVHYPPLVVIPTVQSVDVLHPDSTLLLGHIYRRSLHRPYDEEHK